MQVVNQIPRKVKAAALTVASAGALVALLFLAVQVVRELDLRDSAQSDSVQWTLSQVEVEFLKFELSVSKEKASDKTDLNHIRQEFDIFYSRVTMISESSLYSALRDSPQYRNALRDVQVALHTAARLIDSPDEDLQRRLPDLGEIAATMRGPVRKLSSSGLNYFATSSDQQRESVAATLLQLGGATLASVSLLLATSVVLFRQCRLSDSRADALKRTASRLQTIVGTSLDAIVVSDQHGNIVEFNPAAEATFGYKRADVLGKAMQDTIVPEKYRAMHAEGMARYRETGEKRVIGTGRVRLEAQHQDGSVFPVELSIQADHGTDGELFVSFCRDISQQIEAEQELVEARDRAVAGDKAKTEFLAVMSHEIRTPLNGLLGTMSLLQETRLSSKQRTLLTNMQASGRLLLRHANDVLDVTKHDAGKTVLETTDVDLGALIQSVVDNQRDLAAVSGSVITWTWCGNRIANVHTDPFRLRQILINLVSNAVKFTHNGRITIEVEAELDHMMDAMISLRVIDTGVGIQPDDIERLFEDFETGDSSYGRAAGGTGLGLGICRRLAEALGGEIGADSELGQGSVFWLTFPARVATGSEAEEPADLQAVSTTTCVPKSVLIIEDNEINRVVLRGHLESAGHKVTEAEDGLDGVAAAAKRQFDIILSDISMPHLDGISATRAIRDSDGPNKDTPIIAVTAHAMPHQIEEFRAAGMNGFVSKPIDRACLQTVLAGDTIFETAAQVSATPDPDHLAELEVALGRKTLEALMVRFISEGDTFAADLASTTKPCAKEMAQRGHQLAGSAAMLGFDHLKQLLNDLETQVHDGSDPKAVTSSVERFSAAWSSIQRPPSTFLN